MVNKTQMCVTPPFFGDLHPLHRGGGCGEVPTTYTHTLARHTDYIHITYVLYAVAYMLTLSMLTDCRPLQPSDIKRYTTLRGM